MSLFRRPLFPQLAWHALTVLVLVCLPLVKYGMPWWDLPRRELLFLALLLGAYGASALAILLFVHTQGWRAAGRALAITLSIFSLVLLLFVLSRLDAPRYLLLPVFAAAAVLLPLSVSTQWLRLAGFVMLGIALIGITALAGRSIIAARQVEAKAIESQVKTAFYALRMMSHEGLMPTPATRGGGLDHLGERVLLGTGDGHLYALTIGEGDDLKVEELPTQVPLNREEFAAAFGGSARAPLRSVDYSDAGPPKVQTWRFRVADVIAQTRGDTIRIFASHHFWKEQEQCFVVRVSQLDAATLDGPLGNDQWQTIYESAPCIPLTGTQRKRGKNPFSGEEIGGSMALLDEDTLLLTLGDHGFDGVASLQAYAQDPQAAYGKTLRINLATRDSEIYTLGHRNPQGLYVAQDHRVWLAEHAAQGGDEVNLLVANANYGWPIVTYGTDYGSFAWAPSQQQGRHAGYTKPVHAWLPGIGVSSLIGVERDRFNVWQGDLIAGSLATRSLYRLVVDGDRVVLNEPIPIGKRIRDLLELNDGRILLWTDDAALVTIEPAVGMSTALQFTMLCGGCHNVSDGLAHRIGPDLYRVQGRKVASAAGFDEYSPGLKQFGGEWSRARLDAYLRDPQGTVPGTTMAFSGIKDDQERAALLDHLETLNTERRR